MPRTCSASPLLLMGFVAGALLLSSGCIGDDEEDAPFDCVRNRPDFGILTVDLTVNDENPRVYLTLYRGDFEAGDLLLRDTLSVETAAYELPVDHYYSVTARYIAGRDTILAIDGASIDAKSTDYRNARCWEVTDAHVDVRLVR